MVNRVDDHLLLNINNKKSHFESSRLIYTSHNICKFESLIHKTEFTLENSRGTWKSPDWKGKSSSKPSLLCSMLIFRGVHLNAIQKWVSQRRPRKSGWYDTRYFLSAMALKIIGPPKKKEHEKDAVPFSVPCALTFPEPWTTEAPQMRL